MRVRLRGPADVGLGAGLFRNPVMAPAPEREAMILLDCVAEIVPEPAVVAVTAGVSIAERAPLPDVEAVMLDSRRTVKAATP